MPLLRVNGEVGVVSIDMRFGKDSGTPVANVRVVAKKRVKDSQTGAWTDGDPTFIDVVVFGQMAENIAESVTPGDLLMVSGDLEEQEWTTPEGEKKRKYRIVADGIGPCVRWNQAPVIKTPRTTPMASSQATDAPF